MAYRNNTLEKHFNQATANLTALRAEQENIQAKQIHTGFIDASTRARLSYEVEALDRSLRREREQLADGQRRA